MAVVVVGGLDGPYAAFDFGGRCATSQDTGIDAGDGTSLIDAA